MNTTDQPINLLWTGGWDSTFRFLQIVIDYKHPVQPFYIIDTGRDSTLIEIDTRNDIIQRVKERYPFTADLILPTKFSSLAEVVPNKEINEKFNVLKSEMHIGSQYGWLPMFARQHGIDDLELSLEKSDRVTHFNDMDLYEPVAGHPAGNVSKMKDSISDDNPKSIYKYFHFPLFDFTKIDMREHSKEQGYFDILNHSWFCFTPIKGKPCGLCNPCKNVVVEGLEHRMPPESLLRNKYHKAFEAAALVKKTAKRQVRKVFPNYN